MLRLLEIFKKVSVIMLDKLYCLNLGKFINNIIGFISFKGGIEFNCFLV